MTNRGRLSPATRGERAFGSTASERGAASTELAIMLPVLMAMVVLAVLAGRVVHQDSSARSAADYAARAASLHTTQVGAATAAVAALSAQSGSCAASSSVSIVEWVDPKQLEPGYVTVEVTCVQVHQNLGGPVTRTEKVRATSVLGFWRSRS